MCCCFFFLQTDANGLLPHVVGGIAERDVELGDGNSARVHRLSLFADWQVPFVYRGSILQSASIGHKDMLCYVGCGLCPIRCIAGTGGKWCMSWLMVYSPNYHLSGSVFPFTVSLTTCVECDSVASVFSNMVKSSTACCYICQIS